MWDVENRNDYDLEVSIMFTLLNGSGHKDDKGGGHWNEPFHLEKEGEAVSGVLLHHCTSVNPYTLCMAFREQVNVCVRVCKMCTSVTLLECCLCQFVRLSKTT